MSEHKQRLPEVGAKPDAKTEALRAAMGGAEQAQPAITPESGNQAAQGASAITSESAQAVPPDVARDAERYRMIRKLVYIDPLRDILRIAQTYLFQKDGPTVAEQLDAAIDAVIAAQGAKT